MRCVCITCSNNDIVVFLDVLCRDYCLRTSNESRRVIESSAGVSLTEFNHDLSSDVLSALLSPRAMLETNCYQIRHKQKVEHSSQAPLLKCFLELFFIQFCQSVSLEQQLIIPPNEFEVLMNAEYSQVAEAEGWQPQYTERCKLATVS